MLVVKEDPLWTMGLNAIFPLIQKDVYSNILHPPIVSTSTLTVTSPHHKFVIDEPHIILIKYKSL